MALVDWTQRNFDSAALAEIENTNPIFGIGSLRNAGMETMVTMTEDNYTLGLTRGVMRDLIRPDTWLGTDIYDVGMFFMASQVDLSQGVGSCYTCSVNGDSDVNTTTIQVQFHQNGIETNPIVLFSGPEFDREDSLAKVIAIEIEWVYEPVLLNGIRFIVRSGVDDTLADFSNLAEIGRFMIFDGDPAFLSTSAAEGIYMDSRGGSSAAAGDLDILRDRTRITGLVPI